MLSGPISPAIKIEKSMAPEFLATRMTRLIERPAAAALGATDTGTSAQIGHVKAVLSTPAPQKSSAHRGIKSITPVFKRHRRTYNQNALKTGQRVQDPVSPLPQSDFANFASWLPPASGDLSGRTAHFETRRSKRAHSGKSSS